MAVNQPLREPREVLLYSFNQTMIMRATWVVAVLAILAIEVLQVLDHKVIQTNPKAGISTLARISSQSLRRACFAKNLKNFLLWDIENRNFK